MTRQRFPPSMKYMIDVQEKPAELILWREPVISLV